METGTLGLPVCEENTTDTDISELCSEEFVQSSETDAPLKELPTHLFKSFQQWITLTRPFSEDVEPDTNESVSDSGI